jgi:hypothetical protein
LLRWTLTGDWQMKIASFPFVQENGGNINISVGLTIELSHQELYNNMMEQPFFRSTKRLIELPAKDRMKQA